MTYDRKEKSKLKRNVRNCLCMVLLITAILLLTMPAFATESQDPSPYVFPPNYGPSTSNTTKSGSRITSSVSLAKNPDNARIRIKQEVQSDSFRYPVHSGSSSAGALSYSLSQVLSNVVGYPPKIVYVTYEVYQGTTYDAFAWYKSYPLT